jgi:hypothetical protein
MTAVGSAEPCEGSACHDPSVDQDGQVLYVMNEERLDMHMQLSFGDAAAGSAWLVPVPSLARIEIDSTNVLSGLEAAIRPLELASWSAPAVSGFLSPSSDAVRVVESVRIGPYSTLLIEASDAEALMTWLEHNGFGQPAEALPFIEPHIEKGRPFVALKLEQPSASLPPVVLSFDATEASSILALDEDDADLGVHGGAPKPPEPTKKGCDCSAVGASGSHSGGPTRVLFLLGIAVWVSRRRRQAAMCAE